VIRCLFICFFFIFYTCFFVLARFELNLLVFGDLWASFLFIWLILFSWLRDLGRIKLNPLSLQSDYRFARLLPRTELKQSTALDIFIEVLVTCLQRSEVWAIWFCGLPWFELNRNKYISKIWRLCYWISVSITQFFTASMRIYYSCFVSLMMKMHIKRNYFVHLPSFAPKIPLFHVSNDEVEFLCSSAENCLQ
jgi:hypothetical protein